jgi:DNA-binding beta-propeller fold protein YncE
MKSNLLACVVVILTCLNPFATAAENPPVERHYLYVAVPGVRDYLEYGGHGLLVFDIDNGHRFVKRIPIAGLNNKGAVMNVKGICASAATSRVYISFLESLQCIDLLTEKAVWEKKYEGGADRMSITPDGKTIYLPSLEKDFWNVVDAASGEVITKIVTKSGSHNTLVSADGRRAFLAGLKSPVLTVADAKEHKAIGTVETFGGFIRPFTINGRGTLVFACINDLLGFEVGDVNSGKVIHRVEISGFKKGPVKRHGCPSHGVGLTPDEKEVWVTDAFNKRLHVYNATVMPPKPIESIVLKDEPGWITFSVDGRFAYPSTGDVIDVKSRKIVTTLKDETQQEVQSEKMVEVDWSGDRIARVGDQFGVGRVTGAAAGKD